MIDEQLRAELATPTASWVHVASEQNRIIKGEGSAEFHMVAFVDGGEDAPWQMVTYGVTVGPPELAQQCVMVVFSNRTKLVTTAVHRPDADNPDSSDPCVFLGGRTCSATFANFRLLVGSQRERQYWQELSARLIAATVSPVYEQDSYLSQVLGEVHDFCRLGPCDDE